MSLLILKVIFVLFLTNVNCLFLNLKEGSECTWNNVKGKCVDYRRCSTHYKDVERYRTPPVCAGGDDNPIICCTGCVIYNLTDGIQIQEKRQRIYGKTGVKHYDKCIQLFHKAPYSCHYPIFQRDVGDKVFNKNLGCYALDTVGLPSPAGGEHAKRNEFPHMALLGYGKERILESAQWLCGGTLISETFILTAAHCKSDPIAGELQYVGLGMLKRSDPVSTWDTYGVDKFHQHPEYKPPSKYHDIALVETYYYLKIKLTPAVLPACLAGIEDMKVYNYLVKSEDIATATGWGALGHRRETADVLEKVELQRFDELECAIQYPPSRNLRAGYNHSTQMCYGDRDKPRDTCAGDSGGPLQIRSTHVECLFVVLGVTSYGEACGFTGSAGVYTRVRDYVPWIESIVWWWRADEDTSNEYIP